MRTKRAKRIVDILLGTGLLLLMSYQVTGEAGSLPVSPSTIPAAPVWPMTSGRGWKPRASRLPHHPSMIHEKKRPTRR